MSLQSKSYLREAGYRQALPAQSGSFTMSSIFFITGCGEIATGKAVYFDEIIG
ncbi:hypothetical protein [Paenibacillus qinlingensis]|uniref:hypothetical protein n=1 Tax=Paenibacillus qinlingensis TaxID=1837343 RepID=UPI00286B0C3B|nr:hypothetical protein [Paenibacillus qinlingensis]